MGLSRRGWFDVAVSFVVAPPLAIELEIEGLRPGGRLGRVERVEVSPSLTPTSPVDDALVVGRFGNEKGPLLGVSLTMAVDDLAEDRDLGGMVDDKVMLRVIAIGSMTPRPLALTWAAFWPLLGQTI